MAELRGVGSADFGFALSNWMLSNLWPMRTFDRLSTVLGTDGPYVTQLRRVFVNDIVPQLPFFVGLQEINKLIADGHFSGIENEEDLRRLEGSKPFLTEEGLVADACDFVGFFLGLRPIPEQYMKRPELSAAERRLVGQTLKFLIESQKNF